MRYFIFAPAMLALVLTTGCVAPSAGGGNPYPPVPPPLADTQPPPPVSGTEVIWQPGHWDWNGSGYIWARVAYVPAAGHGNLWMPGWWSQGPGGWNWQPAHWTS